MHNLVLDIGNTNSKIAVFEANELLFYRVLQPIDERAKGINGKDNLTGIADILRDLLDKYAIQYSVLSTVKENFEELIGFLKAKTHYIEFSTRLNIGVKNNYKTPSTLGLDRWAKVIAAYRIYPQQNCLMIDAGTCITYDLLNDQGEYYGGSISPGVYMRFESLNHFTQRLPLIKWNQEENEIPQGSDTITAIKNGVLQGIVNEVQGFIALNNEKNKELKVILTGGDAPFLLKQLKNSIFAPQIIPDPYFVLKGLNEVIAFEYVQKN